MFEAIPQNEFDTIKGGYKTWQHFYHYNFIESGFHKENLDIIFLEDNNKSIKDEIEKHYENVKHFQKTKQTELIEK